MRTCHLGDRDSPKTVRNSRGAVFSSGIPIHAGAVERLSGPVALRMWSLNQQHQCDQGTCYKFIFSGPFLDLLNLG